MVQKRGSESSDPVWVCTLTMPGLSLCFCIALSLTLSPLFWYQSRFKSGNISRTSRCLDIMIVEV